MTVHLPHDEIFELLPAYALDAVEADETVAIELHLRDCPRCRAEVADHREVTGALASGHEPAPITIWDTIVDELESAPPIRLAPVQPIVIPRWRRSLRVGVFAVAAAAMAVVGVRVAQQEQRFDTMQTALEDRTVFAAALAAHANPNARQAELRSAEGVVLAHAVLVADGTGYLWSDGLPRTDPDRAYQLWAVVGSERISVGVLGPSPKIAPFRIAGDVLALAITEEVAGGVVASEHQPVASGLIVEA